MAENITNSSQLAEKALESLEPTASPDQADASAAEKFGELLSQSPEKNVNGQNVLAEGVEQTTPVEGDALTLGDKILRGMQGLRDHVEAGRADVQSAMTPPQEGEVMNMQQMFKTQMAMTNLMVTEDYIGKIVSKSTQTFDTLLKNQ